MFDRFAGDELRDQIISSVPVARVGAADENRCCGLYLASDAAKFTTGTMLVVDAGVVAA
jgi:2-keto-3-deoxy-L-fuconate dehydrogenase